jgi:predicted dehydrogenase
MFKIKVIGAGSIGNHLSQAARTMGWSVDLCDTDPEALRRTREEIYPMRYGRWDDAIRLFDSKDVPRGGYDMIFIGTPPDCHNELALEAIAEGTKVLLVEKPFCRPDLALAQEVLKAAAKAGVKVFTGYDHVVGEATEKMAAVIQSGRLGKIDTLDVEFREFWGGIFAAHPWLSGPSDTYLGFWRKGGGASGEHSHAINLWQHFAHAAGAGHIVEVQAMMEFVSDDSVDYDKLCLMNLRTESGLCGRVVQDVVTRPPRKWARLQAAQGSVEWSCGHQPGVDAVFVQPVQGEREEYLFRKTRPDDFIRELRHIEAAMAGDYAASPISITRGLDTMLVVAAAHKSVVEKRTVIIDYAQGYTAAALK